MSTPPPDSSKGSQRSHLGFARRSYYARINGMTWALLMFVVVMSQKQVPWWVWAGPIVYGLAWPHLAGWLALRARHPRDAERLNLLVDQFLIGVWMVPMEFNLLPCILGVALCTMGCMAGGGLMLVWRGLLLQILGVGLGVAIYGFRWSPESSVMTILASTPLMLIQPFLVGYVAFTAVKSLNQQRVALERLSQHDGLSGLLNRSHWEKLVRAEFARYARSSDPAVLVLADLDHFKRLNDTYGHSVGDDAIRRFAKALKRVLRETDICGRYGGEEFGILLPGTDTAAAREVIERLRRDLHENPMLEGVVVTASFGMVELHREITSVEEWLRVVDKMLYQAKHLGRDRVVELTELTNSALASLEVLPPRNLGPKGVARR